MVRPTQHTRQNMHKSGHCAGMAWQVSVATTFFGAISQPPLFERLRGCTQIFISIDLLCNVGLLLSENYVHPYRSSLKVYFRTLLVSTETVDVSGVNCEGMRIVALFLIRTIPLFDFNSKISPCML